MSKKKYLIGVYCNNKREILQFKVVAKYITTKPISIQHEIQIIVLTIFIKLATSEFFSFIRFTVLLFKDIPPFDSLTASHHLLEVLSKDQ